MNSKKLTVMLQKTPENSGGTPFCPEDSEIAQFYEGSLDDTKFACIERHAWECQYCLGRIGMLARLETAETDSKVPEHLLASAKQFGRVPKSRKTYKSPAWVAAAMVLVALYTLNGLRPQVSRISQPRPAAMLTDDYETRQLRSIDQAVPKLRVLTPAEGTLVNPDDLVIRWTEIPGSQYYDLYIMSDDGDLVLEQRVDDAEWSVRQSGLFAAGLEYYIRVEARLPYSRSVSTNHVLFRIAGQK